MLDEPIDAAACVLPGLSGILSAGQALELASAMRSQEPFGLSVALPAGSETNPNVTVLVHDLFLPTDETLHDQPVLRGIDTSHRIALCSLAEHLDSWVISSSGDRSSWARCEGDVWINRLSGKALIPAAAGRSSLVPTVVLRRGLSEACGAQLRSYTVIHTGA
jgi:hypothetical protein